MCPETFLSVEPASLVDWTASFFDNIAWLQQKNLFLQGFATDVMFMWRQDAQCAPQYHINKRLNKSADIYCLICQVQSYFDVISCQFWATECDLWAIKTVYTPKKLEKEKQQQQKENQS